VKFEKDDKDEKDEKEFDEEKGGAIRKGFKTFEAKVTAPEFSAQVPQQAATFYESGYSSQYLSPHPPTADLGPRILYPMSSYMRAFEMDDEHKIKKGIVRGVSGHGAAHDSSFIQKAVFDSLKHTPALLHTYLNGRVYS
jgi:hypothetical protein